MLDYDDEAERYDDTRGGQPRAEAAAALSRLLPDRARLVLDVAGGTGIVSALLTSDQVSVLVCDTAHGMLLRASKRLPGRALRADATRLPIADASADAVTTVWLLHLIDPPSVEATVGEAARVLRPGGRYITTVDKSAAHGGSSSYAVTDGRGEVTAVAADVGLDLVEEGTFIGHGQSAEGSQEPVYVVLAFEKPR